MLKKILTLALALAVAVACLASCNIIGGGGEDPDPAELMAAAESKLNSDPYTAKVTTTITAKDPALAERLEALGSTTMSISSDGENFKIRMNATLGDVRVLKSYTAKDGVLYLEYMLSVGEESEAVKEKTELSSFDLTTAIAELGAGAEIGYEDFSDISLESGKDGYIVNCSAASDAAIAGAERTLASSLGDDMELNLKELSYQAVLDGDGDLLATVLRYSFSVTLDGVLYNMTSEICTEYEYPAEVSVSAPDDADMYTEVEYGELIR